MHTRGLLIACLLICSFQLPTQAQQNETLRWPPVHPETRPWTRWWWLGNAVDTPGLAYNLQAFQQAGIGGVEITPIYGTKGFEQRFIPFLSPQWMHMLGYTINEGKRLGLTVDMNTGTGWPFGGPGIKPEDAAGKVYFKEYTLQGGQQLQEPVRYDPPRRSQPTEQPSHQPPPPAVLQALMAYGPQGRILNLTEKVNAAGALNWTAPAGSWQLVALFNGKTGQKVKRASPGGEGWVMDHFSKPVVTGYLEGFTTAFKQTGTPAPHAFFNDSYEVFGADWSADLLQEFAKRRGYRLEDYLPAFLGHGNQDTVRRVVNDYRETLSDMLLENFTHNWTSWAHHMGSTTRNQAHGSPANLLDLYAAVDVPECESFGTTHFNIPGLRIDSNEIRHTEANPLMLKFAPSAAHITGKKFASAETFTWLTEHFKTALSQCKPELDNMLLSGVNHVLFHGTPYSPKDAPWPGWLFYASVEFSPYNTFWRYMPAFTGYITRVQSFLQDGMPDNHVLLYWPVADIWQSPMSDPYYQFVIGKTAEWMNPFPFYTAANALVNSGYDVDFISDRLLLQTAVHDGNISTAAGSPYKTIVVPACKFIPLETMQHLVQLAKEGATVVFLEHLPEDVPGLQQLTARRQALAQLKQSLNNIAFTNKGISFGQGHIIGATTAGAAMPLTGLRPETMAQQGLRYIRRRYDQGNYYFIANQQARAFDGWVTLASSGNSAALFDAYTGTSGIGRTRQQNGQLQVYLQLQPDESIIIKTTRDNTLQGNPWAYWQPAGEPQPLTGKWDLAFTGGEPAIKKTFTLDKPSSWTLLPDSAAKIYAGAGRYRISFDKPATVADDWLLDLGTVRESARIILNGRPLDTLWALPFRTRIGQYLKAGKNVLEVEVVNLPANRIADYDRKGKEWRIFYEINFVNVFYKPFSAADWAPVPSGLLGPVSLVPLKRE
ncbi:glycosyl hydrolase family 2 [Chitinophaga agrisoli]|uniref:Glycosyl hydrolase family 2 n=1 Tax=Chitinophaga agrisoli TaxID=2607653 RepID=A0A5B2VNS5_9BACT|nr:glycosyl hydrolase [Chitinophaga agrisoli]KAA2240036.1 glycosyl hydrolase family 2 [Chitinophaga agrisoli]